MPHAQDIAVTKPAVLFARSKAGLDYAAIDHKDVYLFFMIAAPKDANEQHLHDLATLSKLLLDQDFVCNLKAAETKDEVLALFEEAENKANSRQDNV